MYGPSSVQIMELNILERIVAGSEEPSHLDLPLLRSITDNFSKNKIIGVGGCGQVYKVTCSFFMSHAFIFPPLHISRGRCNMLMAMLKRCLTGHPSKWVCCCKETFHNPHN